MDTKDATIMPGRGIIAEVDVSQLREQGDAVRFEYTDRLGQEAEGFVMLWDGELVSYENRCPHWSVPVGYDGEQFLGPGGKDIVCPMHGARFHPDSGKCWSGPCIGDGLEKFDVERTGDTATIHRNRLRLALI